MTLLYNGLFTVCSRQNAISLSNVAGFRRVYSPTRRRTSLSPVSAEIVDIGTNLEECVSLSGDKTVDQQAGKTTLKDATSPPLGIPLTTKDSGFIS